MFDGLLNLFYFISFPVKGENLSKIAKKQYKATEKIIDFFSQNEDKIKELFSHIDTKIEKIYNSLKEKDGYENKEDEYIVGQYIFNGKNLKTAIKDIKDNQEGIKFNFTRLGNALSDLNEKSRTNPSIVNNDITGLESISDSFENFDQERKKILNKFHTLFYFIKELELIEKHGHTERNTTSKFN